MPASKKTLRTAIYTLLLSSIVLLVPVVGHAHGAAIPAATGTVSVSLLINYGNGTLAWYNGTSVPNTWNFYNVTVFLTGGNIASIFFASFGSHFVYLINGVGCGTVFGCDSSWSLWTLKGTCWQLSDLGVDQTPVSLGRTVAWFFTPVANFGEIPPTGVNCIPVNIDVKPPDDPASINPTSQGTTPVAILSSSTFNATTTVNTSSLTFGRTGTEHSPAFCKVEDVNGDGLPDLLCHFNTLKAGFQPGDTEAILNGQTIDGTPIVGTDSVIVI